VFLAMGRDKANGRLSLSPVTRELQVQWDVPANLPLYRTQEQLCEDVARALGTRSAYNPLWERLHLPVSVHNLGGCAMAAEPAYGVLDDEGQVHGYPGLYVFDGAALPVGIGVNPSSSIAAVAERNVERAIRKVKNLPGWVAPERGPTKPVVADPTASQRVGLRMMPVVEAPHTPVVPGTDPLGEVVIPPGGTVASPTPVVGLRFTERMKGYLRPGHAPADDFAGAARAGQRSGDVAEFVVTITLPNLDRFLAQESHGGIVQGTLHVRGFTPPGGAPVENGVFNLFVGTERFYERRMLYLMPFTGVDGQPYLLDGYKEVNDDAGFDVWSDTSTLYTVLRKGHERTGPIVATGIIRLHLPDFLQQLTTFSVLGTSSPLKQADAMRRFGGMFMGTLWDVFARAKFD
ncbi:MAG: GMC family oxidoreductase, partial [Myxococcaceae bacterium]